jgi:sulfatase modifying factor 1
MGRALVLALGLPGLAACGNGNLASRLATPPDFQARGGDSKCGVVKSLAKPLIVEWSPSDRGELESQVRRGLVAVHYEGCEMEVLDRCRIAGSYAYTAITPKHDTVEMHDADDLYAKLPLGAAKLESTLSHAGSLKVAMTIVGRYEASVDDVSAADLTGDCARATHYVAAVTTGAFDFYAEGEASVAGGAHTLIGDAGVQGDSASRRQMITTDGDEEACKRATGTETAPPPGCGALIRIEVASIGATKTHASTMPGSPSAGPPVGVAEGGMVALPGGSFTMRDRGETVSVRPFSLDVTEVTADAYASCVRSGACSADQVGPGDSACNYGVPGRGNHPINCVDWDQASAYCRSQGKRLPTEEEWEWAARGASERRSYPWGNAAPGTQACWSGITRRSGTCLVGSIPAGDAPGGIHDLAGNVWEWTSSNFDAASHVIRGGSWGDDVPSRLRSSSNSGRGPSYRDIILGFRCAR